MSGLKPSFVLLWRQRGDNSALTRLLGEFRPALYEAIDGGFGPFELGKGFRKHYCIAGDGRVFDLGTRGSELQLGLFDPVLDGCELAGL